MRPAPPRCAPVEGHRNGAAIAGATGSTLVLANVQTASATDYTVTVSNTMGAVASNAAKLTVTANGDPSPAPSGRGGGDGATSVWLLVALAILFTWRRIAFRCSH